MTGPRGRPRAIPPPRGPPLQSPFLTSGDRVTGSGAEGVAVLGASVHLPQGLSPVGPLRTFSCPCGRTPQGWSRRVKGVLSFRAGGTRRHGPGVWGRGWACAGLSPCQRAAAGADSAPAAGGREQQRPGPVLHLPPLPAARLLRCPCPSWPAGPCLGRHTAPRARPQVPAGRGVGVAAAGTRAGPPARAQPQAGPPSSDTCRL